MSRIAVASPKANERRLLDAAHPVDERDHRGGEQRQDDGIGELLEHLEDGALALGLGELVRAVARKALLGFGVGQPVCGVGREAGE